MTCKAKRLKCDEKKPTCEQCHKRQVECGGYKKDFKWRAFEEATFTTKPTSPKFKKSIDTLEEGRAWLMVHVQIQRRLARVRQTHKAQLPQMHLVAQSAMAPFSPNQSIHTHYLTSTPSTHDVHNRASHRRRFLSNPTISHITDFPALYTTTILLP